MKNHSIKVALFLFVAFLQISVYAKQVSQLDALYRNRQYFELRDELAKRTADKSPELLFYRGAVANKFNQSQESNLLLQSYLKSAEGKSGKLCDAYELLADNFVKTYQYAKAADTYKLLLDKFGGEFDADKKRDAETSFNLWNALRGAPPQTVSFAADTRIQATRDKAALLNVPVEINKQSMNFVFDTGANLSTVTALTAQKLNLKIIDAELSIGSSTDQRVASKLAVAPNLKIGSVILRNVIFLVLEDKALFFPQINYQINGIVGFPVIEAFRAVTITRKDEVFIKARPAKRKYEQNMCLDELMPLVAVAAGDERKIFVFDTGAVTSSFYPAFYKSRKEEIEKRGKKQSVKIGGAGGFKEIVVYVLDEPTLAISGKTAKFNRMQVLTEPVNEESRYYDGVFGQGLIKQFASLTLDFDSMSIIFE